MEKVFSDPELTKFDVRKLSDINKPMSSSKLDDEPQLPPVPIKYNEKDQDRKQSLHFLHQL